MRSASAGGGVTNASSTVSRRVRKSRRATIQLAGRRAAAAMPASTAIVYVARLHVEIDADERAPLAGRRHDTPARRGSKARTRTGSAAPASDRQRRPVRPAAARGPRPTAEPPPPARARAPSTRPPRPHQRLRRPSSLRGGRARRCPRAGSGDGAADAPRISAAAASVSRSAALERRDVFGERGDAPAAAVVQQSACPWPSRAASTTRPSRASATRRTRPSRSMPTIRRVAVGAADLLGSGEPANRDRPAEHHDRQRRRARRRQPHRVVLAPQAAQQVDGGRMQAVGDGAVDASDMCIC